MARFNELLNTGALYSRAFGILLGTQEQEGVTTVSPEIMAIFNLSDELDRIGIVYKLLSGLISGLAAGGVGFRSQISLDNPAGSNSVVILERLEFTSTVAETLVFSWSVTQLTGSTGNLGWRDGRRILTPGFGGGFAARIRTQNNAAIGPLATTIDAVNVPVTTLLVKPLQLIIAPGQNVNIHPNTDNTAITSSISFYVRERPVSDRELIV